MHKINAVHFYSCFFFIRNNTLYSVGVKLLWILKRSNENDQHTLHQTSLQKVLSHTLFKFQ